MAPKSFLVTGLVVMLVVAAPAAEAQLGGIPGLTHGLIQILGTVPCSQTISAAINGTLTPVFPNAQVQLTCGVGNIIATATTNEVGTFSIVLNPLSVLPLQSLSVLPLQSLSVLTLQSLSEAFSNCRLVVPTSLSNCNPALSAGGVLQSTLQLPGNILTGFIILNITPTGFQFLPV